MYQISNGAALIRGSRRLGSREGAQTRVSRTVVLLGLTSLVTDISSEMVVAVLPLYLVAVGGFSPLAFGVIDGLYNGATALVGLAAGYLGDRRRRHKEVAVVGYGLSAACKLVLAVVGTAVSAIGATILIDRVGKGIRTAPRDAMISLATPRDQLGAAFGVHRAMDTTGALIGPILAFSILALAPLAFESLFLVSFCLALVGVGILVLLVDGRRTVPGAVAAPRPPSLRGAAALLKIARYRALLVAAGLLGLATVSDAFIFLALQEKLDLGASLFPLLFVGSAGTFMVLSVPIGVLADRIGRARVLLGGYAAIGGVYAVLLAPLGGWSLLVLSLGLLGTYYAATDGTLAALGSAIVPEDVRGSGLALLRTATSIARLIASVAFGALWALWSIDAAIACFAAALAAAALIAALAFLRTRG